MVRFETPYNKHENPPYHSNGPAEGQETSLGARSWNSWWSRRSPNLNTNDNAAACIGIDIGSKTIKLAALDTDGNVVFALYHRHRSDVRTTLAELLRDVIWRYGDLRLPTAITGSAGIALAEELGLPFVQEVVATTNAVRKRFPQANCIIELGGEDAKITYLDDPVEQRMNATCAGGTGDFIDGIASMLGVKSREMSKLALGAQRTYGIASRCAVFAQTDVRPLINAGASKADIAQSALDAVVRQTLGGLACGRPIRGTVVFLGGPLEHIPALVITFRRKLGLTQKTGIKPADAHLFAAFGAIETADDAPAPLLSELAERAMRHSADLELSGSLPALFENDEELRQFQTRHAREGALPSVRLGHASETLYLGFDAGSTTCKYALIDETGALVASDYREVEGDSFATARAMLEGVLTSVQTSVYSKKKPRIVHATVTGYGEDLLRAGLGFDSGVVETVAHLRAAQSLRPKVSFVLDIGGQDMKALWVRDGAVVDAVLNETCSSGCGAFVSSTSRSLQLASHTFSKLALEAAHPVDLGAKCTVFMTSRVRHAQKLGAPKGDIAAGIAYSVANNVMTRIIGKSHALPLGDDVVVQGGTFKSDAVLRAFEKVTGVTATRPNAAHLMGAYGAALVARDRAHDALAALNEHDKGEHCASLEKTGRADRTAHAASSLLPLNEVRGLHPKRTSKRCPGCGNACLVSIVDFGGGRRFVSGNRCERAYEALFGERAIATSSKATNIVALEQKLIAQFGDVSHNGPRGGTVVGLMNAMNVYESVPFWHTLFAQLGFSIVVPCDGKAAHLSDRAAETIPSESVCHPAKVAHLRYAHLVEKGAHVVFMPRFERGTRCPVACSYACALADNVEDVRLSSPTIKAIRPKALRKFPHDLDTLFDTISGWANNIERDEFLAALELALQEQERFEKTLADAAAKVFDWLGEDPSRRAAIVAGRPYHVDPALIHGIDEELARLGFAVIPMLALEKQLHAIRSKRALWKPSKHLCELVQLTVGNPQLEIVGLRSFGCGFDAVSFDEAHDLANSLHRPFTELKIDDIADHAHIRIRLRTLAYTSGIGNGKARTASTQHTIDDPHKSHVELPVTSDLCSTAKALIQLAKQQLNDGNPNSETLHVPRICLECLTDALPYELVHTGVGSPSIEFVASSQLVAATEPHRCGFAAPRARTSTTRPKVGLVGNPLLVFNDELNEHVADLVETLGWQLVYPDPDLVEIEDVRYLAQLEEFRRDGVQRVLYLQSFGCLKGHVQSRGALHGLAQRFPDLPITVIDYDPESSALNRENRIRLALATGSQA